MQYKNIIKSEISVHPTTMEILDRLSLPDTSLINIIKQPEFNIYELRTISKNGYFIALFNDQLDAKSYVSYLKKYWGEFLGMSSHPETSWDRFFTNPNASFGFSKITELEQLFLVLYTFVAASPEFIDLLNHFYTNSISL